MGFDLFLVPFKNFVETPKVGSYYSIFIVLE